MFICNKQFLGKIFFLYFLKGTLFTFPQQALNFLLWVTTSTSVLKSHTGATQALTGARESCFACLNTIFVHYYSFFSVFGLWHKANSAHFSGSNEKMLPNQKIDLQSYFFRVNITHHEGDFFCFVSCVHRKILNQKRISRLAVPPVPTSLLSA